MDLVSGRGAVVFDNTDFRVVNSRTQQEGYVFAPATQSNLFYGFLAVNSRFNAAGDGVAQLGRSLDVDSTPLYSSAASDVYKRQAQPERR